ncbi:hypothetical protein [Phaeocystidibacter marisrubri]|uniref:Septum formation initiator n=1 Tax=Phaeocystidibacter marisrubri TaxID=1577780 RepID=A0A6L3ZKQ8_9FLAO|nr:hypothetical protein [Phaeocystidibacter marisrubri]KAB2818128.1 hypothetical protein F8C82_06915 [Phaeocystidibacter marisrubri]GGH71811.1 hypothetical protein GCM10011318_15150 [Phaeocystidibacter marisrubri]
MVDGIANTENFFKFAFLSGMVMIVFALVYPLQREEELLQQKAEVNAEYKRVEYAYLELKSEIDLMVDLGAKVDSLLRLDTLSSTDSIRQIYYVSQFDSINALSESKDPELNLMLIELGFKREMLSILKNKADEFRIWKYVLFGFGAIFAIYGGVVWHNWSRKEYKLLRVKK